MLLLSSASSSIWTTAATTVSLLSFCLTTTNAGPAPAPLPLPNLPDLGDVHVIHPKASRFTFFNMTTPLAGPCDLCTGPDGAIWVQDIAVDKLARIDQHTGQVEEYHIPYTRKKQPLTVLPQIGGRTVLACAIRPGRDGNIYAASGIRNQLVKLDIKTKKIKVFTPEPFDPAGNLFNFNDLWGAPEGMYSSQTTGDVITLFDYKKETFRTFKNPTKLGGPLGMRLGADGALWYCEFFASKIGRLNGTSGEIKEYSVPAECAGPGVMRAQTKNRLLWFTGALGNSICSIDIHTGKVKGYPIPEPLQVPLEDANDRDGNIWYSTPDNNFLPYLTPKTGKFTFVKVPGSLVSAPGGVPPQVDIPIHYGPGHSIWFASISRNQVGRYSLDRK